MLSAIFVISLAQLQESVTVEFSSVIEEFAITVDGERGELELCSTRDEGAVGEGDILDSASL